MAEKQAILNIYQPVIFDVTLTFPDGGGNSIVDCHGCRAVSFKNKGTATVTIDKGYSLSPNEALELNCNLGEYMTNKFNLTYSAAGTRNVSVIKKEYQ